MALTLAVEQRLRRVNLIRFFEGKKAIFQQAAQRSKDFLKASFPNGAEIRRDDLALALLPIMEVDQMLRNELDAKRLTQKYWISNFVDLIVDRTWASLT